MRLPDRVAADTERHLRLRYDPKIGKETKKVNEIERTTLH